MFSEIIPVIEFYSSSNFTAGNLLLFEWHQLSNWTWGKYVFHTLQPCHFVVLITKAKWGSHSWSHRDSVKLRNLFLLQSSARSHVSTRPHWQPWEFSISRRLLMATYFPRDKNHYSARILPLNFSFQEWGH